MPLSCRQRDGLGYQRSACSLCRQSRLTLQSLPFRPSFVRKFAAHTRTQTLHARMHACARAHTHTHTHTQHCYWQQKQHEQPEKLQVTSTQNLSSNACRRCATCALTIFLWVNRLATQRKFSSPLLFSSQIPLTTAAELSAILCDKATVKNSHLN